ncbi:MAG: hypothetical protein JW827_04285, partial [Spirochaetes bacterium]|nr:hypothetical protein [Spirochaetota bacterium]
GSLDSFGFSRKQLFFLAPHITKTQNPTGLLDLETIHIPFKDEFTIKKKIIFEIETFGFAVTENPLVLIPPESGARIIRSYEMINYVNCHVSMLGIKICSKRIPSKKKKGFMKFISFLDLWGSFETFLPTKNYGKLISRSVSSSIFLVSGKITEEFGACTLHLEDMKPLSL